MQDCTHLSRFALVSRGFAGRYAKKYTGHCIIACVPIWQGKKASNPRPTVLETAALPAELFPCIKFGGPSGTRTPDRPVMSRLLYQLS